MPVEPGWCGVCGLPVPPGVTFCPGPWPTFVRAIDGQYYDEAAPWVPHRQAFLTELVELQAWRCPWCGDDLPDSPPGTAVDHIIPKVCGGPHRRWNLQLLHKACNSAKGDTITAEALELADAHGVAISMDVEKYRAGVRHRAVMYALRETRQLGTEARERAVAAARNLTVFFPEANVRALIRAAAEGT